MSLHLVQAQSSHKRALSLACTVEHCESQLSRIVNKSAISKRNLIHDTMHPGLSD